MIHISTKAQKRLLISGLSVLCIVLVVALFAFIGSGSEKKKIDDAKNDASTNVTVNDIKADDKTGVTVPDITKTPTVESHIPASENAVLDVDKKQDVEVALTKPAEKPTEPEKPVIKDDKEIKNPEKPPVYDKKQTTIEPKISEPKSGDKKDGKVYIPGFGWVKDEGGGGKGEVVTSDGDINKQVGQMN